jgi:light-regulated signal transduction histidine kinase (bacteriophytochrome)
MSHLIRDVLAYSRATSESERVVQNVNLNEVLASVLETLQTRIVETQAEIVHDSLPVIEGDASRLGQVVQNLLSNALKYRREGSIPEISILATRRSQEWLFTIRDNGQGFSQDYAEKIFGIFKRLHGVELPGSGIGLAICKTVIERHGGRIWAESEDGRGAAFHFSLPAMTREGTYER